MGSMDADHAVAIEDPRWVHFRVERFRPGDAIPVAMETVRVVWGVASADTAVASYDAALAEANLHDHNLLPVSSVLPSGATVDPVGRAPDLGAAGGLLPVVQARVTAADADRLAAGLGWIVSEKGPGVVYEAAGRDQESVVRDRIDRGLTEAATLRNWAVSERTVRTVSTQGGDGAFTTALVVAAYGRPDPIL